MSSNKSFRELKKAISGNVLKNIYIFYGEEAYLRDYYFSEIKKRVLTPEFQGFNYRKLEGKGLDMETLSEAVEVLPSFSDYTLVEVRDLDIYKCAEDAGQKLGEIMKNLPQHCYLVFIYDTIEFKTDKRRKIHSIIEQYADLVDFPLQETDELTTWVVRRFKSVEKNISRENAEYLIHYCGSYMMGLVTEIEKISSYCTENEVSREDIDRVAVPIIDTVAFNLVNAISKNDYNRAAEIMSQLFVLRESSIMLLAIIASQLRKIYAACLTRNAGKGIDYLKALLSLRSGYQAERLMESSLTVSRHWCEKVLCYCAETDLMMKSSAIDENELLTSFLLLLAGEHKL